MYLEKLKQILEFVKIDLKKKSKQEKQRKMAEELEKYRMKDSRKIRTVSTL